jgi:SAM-dependent methyltransferase
MEYPGKELEAMTFARNYHDWIVDELSSHLGQVVVEVGAGSGALSRLLLDKGIEKLFAFEPSNKLYIDLRESLGNERRAHLINNILEPELFPPDADSVVYVNVLEHIEDDLNELRKVKNGLRSGGSLLIFVPALPALFSEVDSQMGHFRRYTKQKLLNVVEHSGFQVQSVKYMDFAGVLPWYLNFKLLKRSFSVGSVSLYDRAIIPWMRKVEEVIRPPLGKNLLLIAKNQEISNA